MLLRNDFKPSCKEYSSRPSYNDASYTMILVQWRGVGWVKQSGAGVHKEVGQDLHKEIEHDDYEDSDTSNGSEAYSDSYNPDG